MLIKAQGAENMFAKLNQVRQNFSIPLPLPKPKKAQSQYKFEWVEDLKTLKEVQKFRAVQFADQFYINFT